jgi:hypothetical protein
MADEIDKPVRDARLVAFESLHAVFIHLKGDTE